MGEPLNPSSQMQPPPSPPRSNIPMLYYGLVVVGTAAIVLVLYNLVVVKWCSDITQQPQRRTRRSHGSTSSRRALNFIGINFISSFKYERDGDGDSECIVCLSAFEEGEEIRQLPKCKHYFHAPCIDMWLYSHMDCPICRSPVLHQHATTEQSENSHEVAEQSEQSREGLLDPGMLV